MTWVVCFASGIQSGMCLFQLNSEILATESAGSKEVTPEFANGSNFNPFVGVKTAITGEEL